MSNEKEKARKRAYYLENREKYLSRMKDYYSKPENKERRSKNFQRWKSENPEKIKNYKRPQKKQDFIAQKNVADFTDVIPEKQDFGAKVELTGTIYNGSIKKQFKKDGTPYYSCSLEFLTQYGGGKPFPQWIEIKTYFDLCGKCFNKQKVSISGELRSEVKQYFDERRLPVKIRRYFIFANEIKSEFWLEDMNKLFEKAKKELETIKERR
jgi:hypothetical protein